MKGEGDGDGEAGAGTEGPNRMSDRSESSGARQRARVWAVQRLCSLFLGGSDQRWAGVACSLHSTRDNLSASGFRAVQCYDGSGSDT